LQTVKANIKQRSIQMKGIPKHKLKLLNRAIVGSHKDIAKEIGVSEQTVSSVLNGKYYREDIIDAAIRIRDEQESKRAKVIERM